ncbi:bleomycin resistance protein [Methylobacterium sp. Leaf118]|uniref:bleomycin resistance protein n=1 Tax=Methylobacterium sp. Leaf118 TaxID=2876562 RepID=UPI001E460F8E|nr:VOC family protein [Methylobacterium sp. Leaf118]
MAPRSLLAAILPCRDLDVSEGFYARLGFTREAGQEAWQATYRLLRRPDGARLHLRQAEAGWIVPERNPFGLYLYAEDIDALAAGFPAAIIGADGPEDKSWGMREFAVSDPDGTLVRVGRALPA